MQRSACRPTSSARVVGAAVVEQDEVEGPRSVAVGRAGPHGGVRVHPLGGRRARQRSGGRPRGPASVGTIFSMPTTEISVSGRVRHMRPLPSDSTTTRVPVSATMKLAPETPTLARRNFSRRCSRAASARSAGSSVSPSGRGRPQLRHPLAEDVADLAAVAVDRRDQDVRGPVVAELDDELGEVGLVGVDALGLERLVEADLLGGHRLDLDDLASRRVASHRASGDDAVGLVRVGGPVHGAAGRGDRLLQLHQVAVEMAQGVVLDRLPGLPQLLPSRRVPPTALARLSRMVWVAWRRFAAQPGVASRPAACGTAACREGRHGILR